MNDNFVLITGEEEEDIHKVLDEHNMWLETMFDLYQNGNITCV